jgi:hypothetical protein
MLPEPAWKNTTPLAARRGHEEHDAALQAAGLAEAEHAPAGTDVAAREAAGGGYE